MSVAAPNTDDGIDEDIRRLLVESASAFAARELTPGRLRDLALNNVDFDRGLWKQMAELGWTGLVLPEDSGGYGLALPDVVGVIEELAKPLLPEPLVSGALAPGVILRHAAATPVRDDMAARLCGGNLVAAVAWGPTGDCADIIASSNGKDIALRGIVTHVLPARGADGFLVPATGETGIYWLPADATGVTAHLHTRPDRGTVATLRIDATVPQGNRVIGPNEASAVLAAARDWALVAASAELLGLIRGALGMTIDYMKTRKQFGRAIGSFQALQHRVVNLHLQQELVSACVADAAEEIATTSDPVARVRAASRAKARASDAALLVTREAIQLHGGIGFTEEHDIGLYLKRALVLSAWLGNGATHVRRYAELDR